MTFAYNLLPVSIKNMLPTKHPDRKLVDACYDAVPSSPKLLPEAVKEVWILGRLNPDPGTRPANPSPL